MIKLFTPEGKNAPYLAARLTPGTEPHYAGIMERREAWLAGEPIDYRPQIIGELTIKRNATRHLDKILRGITYDNLAGHQPADNPSNRQALGRHGKQYIDMLFFALQKVVHEDALRGNIPHPKIETTIRGGWYQQREDAAMRWHVDHACQQSQDAVPEMSDYQMRYAVTWMGLPTEFATGPFSVNQLTEEYYLADTPHTPRMSPQVGKIVRFEHVPHRAPQHTTNPRLFGAAIVGSQP